LRLFELFFEKELDGLIGVGYKGDVRGAMKPTLSNKERTMKNVRVTIMASEALEIFLTQKTEEPDFPRYYRNVLHRAVMSVEDSVNLRRLDAGDDFDSVWFATIELAHLLGLPRSEVSCVVRECKL